jgi:hypothetical protein
VFRAAGLYEATIARDAGGSAALAAAARGPNLASRGATAGGDVKSSWTSAVRDALRA